MNPEIRDLSESDLPEAIRLLCEGFPRRAATYWRTGFDRLARRDPPQNTVRIGHAIFDSGTMRGVILAIPSTHENRASTQTFVNISSWYVQSSHRGAPAKQLYRYASSRHPDVTYTNLSAKPHTLKAIRAMGFQEWTAGQLLCVGTKGGAGRTRIISAEKSRAAGLPDPIARTLMDHERFGCISFCIETPTKLAPFVFLRRRVRFVPCAQLIYCESLDDLIPNGRAISASLAMRGYPAMIVDANGPVPGLPGRYFAGRSSKYFRGPAPAVAVDHTYSEMIFLGF
jgi:hypothetical protein